MRIVPLSVVPPWDRSRADFVVPATLLRYAYRSLHKVDGKRLIHRKRVDFQRSSRGNAESVLRASRIPPGDCD
jgi:hypothetical protein